MDQYAIKDFGKILKRNAKSQRHELQELGTDCFRIYDRNLGAFPVTVDLYGKYARVVDYGEQAMSDEDRETCLDIVNRMAYVDRSRIVYTYRAKREGREQHEKSEEAALCVDVKENGLSFRVDLTTYTDTGLFLDQILNRQMIKERSAGMDVLNLFSYTGSFSVYAAAGLAKSVTSVDLSATYTKWAVENLEKNGYQGDTYKCLSMDAKKFLEQAEEEHTKYDIVIFDPPAFSNSHKMEHDFDIQRDYVEWIKMICRVLRPSGFILFSTNLSEFKMDKRHLRGLGVKEITSQVKAPGFAKGRKGTVRSWIMAEEDSSLTLDWSEDKKPAGTSEKTEGRNGEGKNDGMNRAERRKQEFAGRDRRREGSPRREGRYSDSDRPRRRFDDRDDRPRRSYDEDRPRRRFDDRDDRPRRSYDEDRPRRRFDDRDDRPRRSYDEDRPRRRFDDRDDRPRRSYDEDRPSRRFDDRDDRPRRSYDEDRPRRRFDDRDDRPRRSFDEDRPRRSFDSDRPRRRFDDDGDRRPRFEKSEYKPSERRSPRKDKPYGFDSFKPARSRNDSADFFWNDEDAAPKKVENTEKTED